MSKAATSPTARLLQHSRLFSLPRPLPQPALETITSTGVYRASDTATIPYPTHQAIVTPPSSHHRGDWGLKRALPKKSTQSSTPHVRVLKQDNTEHITDFGSAADHTQTRAKWLEMGVPVWYKQRRASERSARLPPASVFDTEQQQQPRWKYGGPWLAGMQAGDFERFVREMTARRGADGRRSVKGRSRVDDFREYVKDRIADQELVQARREAQEQGELLCAARLSEIRSELRPREEDLDTKLKEMRDRHATEGLTSDLTAYICEFLDLPSLSTGAEHNNSARTDMLRSVLNRLEDEATGAETAPPSTHPSAGLSYLRTNAIMDNHPLHGPQAHRSPVLARVLRTRTAAQGTEHVAKLGVAGVVANDPISASYNPNSSMSRGHLGTQEVGGYDPDKMAHTLDLNLEGGNKMWVQPQYTWIDEKGHIRLEVTRGDNEAVAVKQDEVEPIHQARAASTSGLNSRSATLAPRGTAANANYGHSLPDMRRISPDSRSAMVPDYGAAGLGGRDHPTPQRRPEIRGFDDELAGEGRKGDQDTASRIRDILGGGSERWR